MYAGANGLEIAFFPYYVKPEFPGGMQEFYRYIGKNFKSKNNGIYYKSNICFMS